MMKKLVLFIVLIAILIFVIKYMSNPSSEEEGSGIEALEEEFKSAQMQLLQAERRAGLSGMDVTHEAQMAVDTVKRIQKRLIELKEELTSEEEIRKAEELEKKIEDFIHKNKI